MHQYTATVHWQKGAQPFSDNRYSRAHEWTFDGGASVPASSSPLSVPEPMSVAANVDPEEALVAATASCHMLFFLSFARKGGFVVESYVDDAIGTMAPDDEGRTAITRIVLRPAIVFAGARQPSAAELAAIHHQSHDHCYIANSLKAAIVVEAR